MPGNTFDGVQYRGDIDCGLLQLSHTLAGLPYFLGQLGNLPTDLVDCCMPPVGAAVRLAGQLSRFGNQHGDTVKGLKKRF